MKYYIGRREDHFEGSPQEIKEIISATEQDIVIKEIKNMKDFIKEFITITLKKDELNYKEAYLYLFYTLADYELENKEISINEITQILRRAEEKVIAEKGED